MGERCSCKKAKAKEKESEDSEDKPDNVEEVAANEENIDTPERRALEKVCSELEKLEKKSDEDDIKIPRKQFQAIIRDVKDALNRAEGRSKQSDRLFAYLIDSSNANAAKSFVEAFQERMKKKGISLSRKQISDTDKLDPSLFLILVCNASSRIEADIEAFFDKIKGEVHKRIILIILHVARRGKAPAEYTSKKLGNSFCSGRYSSVFSITDMAFTIEDGIYECSMNEKAFTVLESIYYTELKTQDPVKMNNTPCTGDSSNRDEATGDTESLLPKSVNKIAFTDLQNSTNLQTQETNTTKGTLGTEDTSNHDEATEDTESLLPKSVNKKAFTGLQNSTNLQTQETNTTKDTLCPEDTSNHDEATEDTESLLPKSVNEKAFTGLQNSTNLQTQETNTTKDTPCTEDTSNHDEATEDTESLLPN